MIWPNIRAINLSPNPAEVPHYLGCPLFLPFLFLTESCPCPHKVHEKCSNTAQIPIHRICNNRICTCLLSAANQIMLPIKIPTITFSSQHKTQTKTTTKKLKKNCFWVYFREERNTKLLPLGTIGLVSATLSFNGGCILSPNPRSQANNNTSNHCSVQPISLIIIWTAFNFSSITLQGATQFYTHFHFLYFWWWGFAF